MEHGSFLANAFVYLLAAVVSVPVAKRLGLGSVLGYLIAGVAIGPFGLMLVGDQSDVMHFAEFGVVMMLFLVGLELRPALLWQMRGPILGLGGLQVLVTALALGAIALAVGLDWRMALAIGMVLALSSTAIVLQTLAEKGLLKTPPGRSSFAVLLFQDIAVIPMLALLPLLAMPELAGADSGAAHGHGDTEAGHGAAGWLAALPGWLNALVVLAAVAAIVLGGRLLIRPAFRFIAETRLREVFTAAALLLVIGIALLMQLVGLSPALGTFLAGVVLADSEFRHELEVDIEPFKGLLLGLFFISVGASIDFDLLIGEPLLILALVVGLIAVKLIVLAGLARAFRMTAPDGLLFAFALAQGGEFAFVLFAFALQNNVLPVDIVSPLIVAVALSMLVTPLLMIAYETLIAPRLSGEREAKAPDAITPEGTAIIAGFGRFGQIVGRLLIANGFRITVLDHSPSQIDLLRRFGNKVYYGDASRTDLLHAAGAEDAALLVVAVDERDKAVEIVDLARKHFPHLKIVARAFDRRDAYALLDRSVDHVSRETFGSALESGIAALRLMGFRAYQAERAGRLFRDHDRETLRQLSELWGDDVSYGDAIRQRTADLERLLQSDLVDLSADAAKGGWDTETLMDEARTGYQLTSPALEASPPKAG